MRDAQVMNERVDGVYTGGDARSFCARMGSRGPRRSFSVGHVLAINNVSCTLV